MLLGNEKIIYNDYKRLFINLLRNLKLVIYLIIRIICLTFDRLVYSSGFYPYLKVADFDLDGDLDVFALYSYQNASRIDLFENLEINLIDLDHDGIYSDEDCDDNDSTVLDFIAFYC